MNEELICSIRSQGILQLQIVVMTIRWSTRCLSNGDLPEANDEFRIKLGFHQPHLRLTL